MTIPYTFAGATTAIPLAQLDANFASPITLGNVAMTLSNTYTSIGNLTLTNVTVSSGNVAVTNANVTTLTVTNDASISGLTVGKGGGAVASNTAVGYQALNSNTTGANNTAVGYQAGYSATGGLITAVGYKSGFSTTSGNPNLFLGYQAGYSNTTGSSNSIVGSSNTFYYNTTGSNNTAFGDSALYNNTTASNNTAVGYQAGYAQTTGASNIFLGYQAGNNSTTNAGCAYIGYLTQSSGTAVIYEQVFGYNLTGKGSSTTYIGGPAYQSNNSAAWSITSDQRLKKNIVDNTIGLDAINQIQVRNFEYRTKDEVTDLPSQNAIDIKGVQLGAIAQELKEILPECVKTESTGVMSVDTTNLTWYLINAVKELNAKITALENK